MARQPKIDSKRKPHNKSGENPYHEDAGSQGGYDVSPMMYGLMKLAGVKGPTHYEKLKSRKEKMKELNDKWEADFSAKQGKK